MSGDCMRFPDTVEEFMDQYKVVDREGIYMSKGSELVPIFRMDQWFEHEKAQLSQEDATIVAKSKRTFVELLVHYPHPDVCTYPEYKGKPYYSIKYIEDGECFVGFGTYKPEVLSQYLRDYFMPSAQPEERTEERTETRACDCISRQAAIDAINHELKCGAVVDQCGLETAHGLIEELPPAQPEEAIPVAWISAQIERLKGMDNLFADLTADIIQTTLNEWRKEQEGETT